MSRSLKIRIVDEDGNPLSGKKVHVNQKSNLGDNWSHEHTDDDGRADFTLSRHWIDEVEVEGETSLDDSTDFEDGETMSFTLPDGRHQKTARDHCCYEPFK